MISYVTDVNAQKACRNGTTPDVCYSSFALGAGPVGFTFQTGDWAGFAQDDWKVTPRLSLTIGVRYDYEQLPSPYASLVNPAVPQTGHFPHDKNNIAPRVGFAYDVGGKGNTVVRGGYGMFYARLINSTIYSALTQTGNTSLVNGSPVSQVQFSFTPTTTGAPVFPLAVPSATGSTSSFSTAVYFDPRFQLPQIHQADLTVEQQLGWSTVFSLSWLGSYGRQLPTFYDQNLPTPFQINYTVSATNKPTTGPLANINAVTTNLYLKTTATQCNLRQPASELQLWANDRYHKLGELEDYREAVVAQVSHRVTNGLMFRARLHLPRMHARLWREQPDVHLEQRSSRCEQSAGRVRELEPERSKCVWPVCGLQHSVRWIDLVEACADEGLGVLAELCGTERPALHD